MDVRIRAIGGHNDSDFRATAHITPHHASRVEDPIDRTHVGDCREILQRMLADGVRVQTCVTSPHYWQLCDCGVTDQIGLEPTPSEYVAALVEVFRLVRQILSEDGTLWLNSRQRPVRRGLHFGITSIKLKI